MSTKQKKAVPGSEAVRGRNPFRAKELKIEQQLQITQRLSAEEGLMFDSYLGKAVLVDEHTGLWYYGTMDRNGANFIELRDVKLVDGAESARDAVEKIVKNSSSVQPYAKRVLINKQNIYRIMAFDDVHRAPSDNE